jgi:hypothetical protein
LRVVFEVVLAVVLVVYDELAELLVVAFDEAFASTWALDSLVMFDVALVVALAVALTVAVAFAVALAVALTVLRLTPHRTLLRNPRPRLTQMLHQTPPLTIQPTHHRPLIPLLTQLQTQLSMPLRLTIPFHRRRFNNHKSQHQMLKRIRSAKSCNKIR